MLKNKHMHEPKFVSSVPVAIINLRRVNLSHIVMTRPYVFCPSILQNVSKLQFFLSEKSPCKIACYCNEIHLKPCARKYFLRDKVFDLRIQGLHGTCRLLIEIDCTTVVLKAQHAHLSYVPDKNYNTFGTRTRAHTNACTHITLTGFKREVLRPIL